MQFSTAEDPTCGLHVHIDVSDLITATTNEEIMNKLMMMMLHFKSAEPVFDRMVAAHRRNSEYAESVRFDQLVKRYSNAIFQLSNKGKLEHIIDSLGEDRYFKLNIMSLHKQPTVEFRQHEGTDKPQKVLLWVSNCLNFINIFNTTEKVFESFLQQAKQMIQAQQKTGIGKEDQRDIRTETLKEISKFIAQRIGYNLGGLVSQATDRIIPTQNTNQLIRYVQEQMTAKQKRIEIDLSKILTPEDIMACKNVLANASEGNYSALSRLKQEFSNTAFIVCPFPDTQWLKDLYQAEYRSVTFRRWGHTATPDYDSTRSLIRRAAGIADRQTYQPIQQLQEAIEELAKALK